MRAIVTLIAVVSVFSVIFLLFVKSDAPSGAILFAPPGGNFTGTTTIATSFGYECVVSHGSGAETTIVSNSTTTIGTQAGIGINCYPEFFGHLQVPVGPEIPLVRLVAFAAAVALLAFYFRRVAMRKEPAMTRL
jgi:hypothetical protein